jgi:hypothetical protein
MRDHLLQLQEGYDLLEAEVPCAHIVARHPSSLRLSSLLSVDSSLADRVSCSNSYSKLLVLLYHLIVTRMSKSVALRFIPTILPSMYVLLIPPQQRRNQTISWPAISTYYCMRSEK